MTRPPPRSTLFPYPTLFRSDICHVLSRRWPLAEIVLSPTPVQGPDAPAGIIGGIEQLNRRGEVDAIIVARGGGSLDRKSTRLNSSHVEISYAVFCLKKKNKL